MADKACSDGTHSFSSSHSAGSSASHSAGSASSHAASSSSSHAAGSSSHAASSSSAALDATDDASLALALALQREEDEDSARDAQLGADEALARQLSGEGRLPPPPEVHSELYRAASCGDLEAVDRLLADGRPADSGVSKFATTPLMVATRHGHREVANTLLKAGASPTQRNSFGETATSLAAQDDGLRALFPGGSHTYAGKNVAKRPCVHCARIVGVGRDGIFCHACGSCQNCGLGVFCTAPRRDAAAADAPPGCFAFAGRLAPKSWLRLTE